MVAGGRKHSAQATQHSRPPATSSSVGVPAAAPAAAPSAAPAAASGVSVPAHTLVVARRSPVVIVIVTLPKVPSSTVQCSVAEDGSALHVDTLRFSRKFVLDVPFENGLRVDTSEDSVRTEWKGWTLKISMRAIANHPALKLGAAAAAAAASSASSEHDGADSVDNKRGTKRRLAGSSVGKPNQQQPQPQAQQKQQQKKKLKQRQQQKAKQQELSESATADVADDADAASSSAKRQKKRPVTGGEQHEKSMELSLLSGIVEKQREREAQQQARVEERTAQHEAREAAKAQRKRKELLAKKDALARIAREKRTGAAGAGAGAAPSAKKSETRVRFDK